jgi:hypothetical protein
MSNLSKIGLVGSAKKYWRSTQHNLERLSDPSITRYIQLYIPHVIFVLAQLLNLII